MIITNASLLQEFQLLCNKSMRYYNSYIPLINMTKTYSMSNRYV